MVATSIESSGGYGISLISSADHKQYSFGCNLPLVDKRFVPKRVSVRRGVPESESADPELAALLKLDSFIALTNANDQMSRNRSQAGGIVDVLFTLNDFAFSTDRDNIGADPTISQMAERLKEESAGVRPVTVNIWNTGAFGRTKDLWLGRRHSLRPETILKPRSLLLMTLSPGLIDVIGDIRKLGKLQKRGLLGPEVVNPKSVCALDWVSLAKYLPAVSAWMANDGLWMMLQAGDERYTLDAGMADRDPKVVKEVEMAVELIDSYARGTPVATLAGLSTLLN